MRLAALFTTVLSLLLALPAWARDVAIITRLQGAASAGGAALHQGSQIRSGTQVITGPAARVELRFIDDTQVVIGEMAQFAVASFVYNADNQQGEALFRVDKGAFLVTTGAVGKLPGHPLSVATPVASIGVRGTKFWGGSQDHPLDVLLLEGAVSVTSKAGSVALTQPHDGTDVTTAETMPSPVGQWKQERIDKALTAVAFD
ncbi:FecR family protein [Magnetospirillum sulfuroxidans]|uniref:FecR domain-containing protein n=1 Tax=Magnetospirillum sulfuroxidans TaxID=611300 RepID=A0ABS5IBY7_9PROT|nr:FecR family protein [Magnetospirillum sulfuroxidans]MBR9971938.1 FecR domain-containing protein [Magnetospirillum sulfuroxidans]